MTEPIDDLPPHWPDPVRDVFEDVEAELVSSGAAHASLVEACELLAKAYALDAVASRANFVTKGSMGQEVLHPAVTEARLARTAATAILGRLIPAKNRGQAIARARHGGVR